jgi:hypothetical protein
VTSHDVSLRLAMLCGEDEHELRVAAAGFDGLPERVTCETCGALHALHHERLAPESGGLRGCLACGHEELFTRKDFPPGLGIAIVVVAAALVPFVPYYLSLFAAAGLDFVLFHLAPEVHTCYVCRADHRGFSRKPRHPRFDHTIAERLRFGERAVMGSPARAGGTADAPEPEH